MNDDEQKIEVENEDDALNKDPSVFWGALKAAARFLKSGYGLPVSILISAVLISGAWIYTARVQSLSLGGQANISAQVNQEKEAKLTEKVLPSQGVTLPVRWGDLGTQLVKSGVIDAEKLAALYSARGGFNDEMQRLLSGSNNDRLIITPENSGFLLNLFWALGLGNKNKILEEGPMVDQQYGGAGNFASTGGWSLAVGSTMDHYARHRFFDLTVDQQAKVEKAAKNIYRPCCGNSTYFPDCNHGMAMLGLLELMAAQGVSEEGMYQAALQINAYWFPDTYLTIARFWAGRGIAWEKINPREILGYNFSSAAGYKQILTQVNAPAGGGGGGCGI